MRKRLILVFLALIVLGASQYNRASDKYLIEFIKIWGYLTVYHPGVTNYSLNVDQVFLNYYQEVDNLSKRKDAQKLFLKIIDEFGAIALDSLSDGECNSARSEELINSLSSSSDIKSRLRNIWKTHNKIPPFIDFSDPSGNPKFLFERSYMPLPDKPDRILGLARFWNMVFYYYPYLDLLPICWSDELDQLLGELYVIDNSSQYHNFWEKTLLILGDIHGSSRSFIINSSKGIYYNIGRLNFIGSNYVFNCFYNDSVADINNLKKGDVVLEINGTPVELLLDPYERIIELYGSKALYRKLGSGLLRTQKPQAKLKICRDQDTLTVNCEQYRSGEILNLEKQKRQSSNFWNIISNNTIYFSPRDMPEDQDTILPKISQDITNLIIDLRGSCAWIKPWASENLFPEKTEFGKWFTPKTNCPGSFESVIPLEIGPENYNPDYFKGKIYLLVNEFTQSQGEFQTMFLQSAPNTVTIGSQTAGADGNNSELQIPGGITLRYSGAAIEYLDGTQCQLKGVKIDYQVIPTIQNIQDGIDPVFEKAVSLINQN